MKIKKAKLPPTSANALTQQALRVLTLKGYVVWRQNNGAVWDPKKRLFRKNKSSLLGVPDILGYHKGTAVVIAAEIKAGKDKVSPEQERFLASVKASGGIALVIRNSDDLVKI